MSTTNSSTSRDDFLSNLPDEILLQILNKLPAEALIKLISVSKKFKSRIRNPQFLEAHLSSSLQNSPKRYFMSWSRQQTLLSNSPDYSWNPIQVPFAKTKARSRLIGNSARGVVCLKRNSEFMLWNPLIKKVSIVPEPVGTNSDMSVCYGFGFDHVNLDFKVVKLSYNGGSITGEAMVYGVKSGCWRTVDSKVPCRVSCEYTGVHVNGIFYWSGMRDYRNGYRVIMGFDFANEVFKVVDLPTNTPYEPIRRLSTSSDGKSLVLFLNNIHGGYFYCTSWSVWYLSTVTDSIWEKKYDLVLDMLFCPLCVLDDDNGTVLAQFKNGTQWVVNGVNDEEESYLSAATEVNKVDAGSSTFGYTSYTPSLALLIDESGIST